MPKKGQVWKKALTAQMKKFEKATDKKAVYKDKVTGQFEYWDYWQTHEKPASKTKKLKKPDIWEGSEERLRKGMTKWAKERRPDLLKPEKDIVKENNNKVDKEVLKIFSSGRAQRRKTINSNLSYNNNTIGYTKTETHQGKYFCDCYAEELLAVKKNCGGFPDYKHFYPPELKELVGRRYTCDIEAFGYEF